MPQLKVRQINSTLNRSSVMDDKKSTGSHLMGDFYDCKCEPELLCDLNSLKDHCLHFVKTVGLNAVGHKFHKFDGGGITGMIVLAESHMSVHTWPENNYVTVDVYVCSYTQDNRPRAIRLYDLLRGLFLPNNENSLEVERL